MNYFLLLLALVFLAGVRPCLRKGNDGYMSRDAALPVKGLFILLVFASHFCQYIKLDPACDGVYLSVRRFLGQMIVVPFLFYSGYGIAESIRRKGGEYLGKLPRQRILNVFLQFAIAVTIYIVVRSFLGVHFSPKRIALCLVGWNSAGNSNWYIFSIILLYLLTWAAHWGFGRKEGRSALLPNIVLTALTLLLIDILSRCRPDYVYNTLFAYVAGVWFAYARQRLEEELSLWRAHCVSLVALVVAYCMLRLEWKSTSMCEMAAVAFALAVVLITMRCRLSNPVLAYCGNHVFSLYILQRLPMVVLKETALARNRYVYFGVCLAISFVLSWVFDKTVPVLTNRICGKSGK